jgi:TM2 domain-containing membrane protein YozV
MATPAQASAQPATASSSLPILCLIAGWLVPGAGHFLLRKPIRGTLIAVSIITMFVVGLTLQGQIYAPNTGDLLDILGFVGQLGTGLLYVLAKLGDWGQTSVTIALGDYGSKAIVIAGLLNVVAAIDAHSLANGRKPSK